MQIQSFVSNRIVNILLDIMQGQGVEHELILSNTKINIADLDKDFSFINYLDAHHLFFNALVHSNWSLEKLFFEIGTKADLNAYGAPGLAAMSSSNIGQAIDIAHQYVDLFFPHSDVEVNKQEEFTHFRLNNVEGIDDYIRNCLIYCAAGSFKRMAKTLTGFDSADPEEKYGQGIKIFLPFEKNDEIGFESIVVGAEVFYNTEQFEIKLPSEFCEYGISSSNSFFKKKALDECKQIHSAQKEDLINRLSEKIYQAEYDFPTIEECAKDFNVSSRTLHRMLNERGYSFRELLINIKMNRAVQLLQERNMNITEIADLLSYSDTASFSKAFKARFSVSPSWYLKN